MFFFLLNTVSKQIAIVSFIIINNLLCDYSDKTCKWREIRKNLKYFGDAKLFNERKKKGKMKV